MELEGKMDENGFAKDDDWFEATKTHEYVDVLRRIYLSSSDLVINKANVIVSFDDGYFYGNKLFYSIVDIAGTHGNTKADSTNGFIMSNNSPVPGHIRSSDVWRYLNSNSVSLKTKKQNYL